MKRSGAGREIDADDDVEMRAGMREKYRGGWYEPELFDFEKIKSFFEEARRAEEEAFRKYRQEEQERFRQFLEDERSYLE